MYKIYENLHENKNSTFIENFYGNKKTSMIWLRCSNSQKHYVSNRAVLGETKYFTLELNWNTFLRMSWIECRKNLCLNACWTEIELFKCLKLSFSRDFLKWGPWNTAFLKSYVASPWEKKKRKANWAPDFGAYKGFYKNSTSWFVFNYFKVHIFLIWTLLGAVILFTLRLDWFCLFRSHKLQKTGLMLTSPIHPSCP